MAGKITDTIVQIDEWTSHAPKSERYEASIPFKIILDVFACVFSNKRHSCQYTPFIKFHTTFVSILLFKKVDSNDFHSSSIELNGGLFSYKHIDK